MLRISGPAQQMEYVFAIINYENMILKYVLEFKFTFGRIGHGLYG